MSFHAPFYLVGAMKTINKEATMQPLIENLDDSLNSAMDSIRNSVHDLHDEAVKSSGDRTESGQGIQILSGGVVL